MNLSSYEANLPENRGFQPVLDSNEMLTLGRVGVGRFAEVGQASTFEQIAVIVEAGRDQKLLGEFGMGTVMDSAWGSLVLRLDRLGRVKFQVPRTGRIQPYRHT